MLVQASVSLGNHYHRCGAVTALSDGETPRVDGSRTNAPAAHGGETMSKTAKPRAPAMRSTRRRAVASRIR